MSAMFMAENFTATILKPGSSFNPTFLAILDGVFACLLLLLVALALLTSGNLHVFFLLAIELSLWASVKWCGVISCGSVQKPMINMTYNRFVNELKNMPIMDSQDEKEKTN
jgi:ER protein Pkr1